MKTVPFHFGIALVPRAGAGDWALVEALLDLTLTSVLAQTDPDFHVVLMGHDRPRTVMDRDPRLTVLTADWPARPTGPHNDDSGRKKHAINDLVLARGGGLFMLLDADDWVDRGLVAAARTAVGPEHVGGLIARGTILDFQTLRAAPLPHAGVFPEPFHRLCGSSTVAMLRPEASSPVRRDPFAVLRSHHQWVEVAHEHGASLADLPVGGAYLVNTSENHSEVHGPHGDWRRGLTAAVNREGTSLDAAAAARFGLELERVRAVSRRFFADGPASRRAAADDPDAVLP